MQRVTRPLPQLADLASQETIDYALLRADQFERKNPMVALVYRIVAEVLQEEKDARGRA